MRKSMSGVVVKDAATGEVEAIFSRYDVIDKDGDVTLKGAFVDGAPVVISAYGHGSWAGALPVGKGVIEDRGDHAVMVGQFFMKTAHGRDTFETVKELGELGEWSYHVGGVKSSRGEFDGQRVRFLEKIEAVKEVSPVLMGAGVDTQTVSTKSEKAAASIVTESLRNAGRERWGNEETYVWLADWDPEESWAVFEVSADGEAERLVRVGYTVADGDDVASLGDDETDVARVVAYSPKSGARFLEQTTTVMADVRRLTDRATEVVALRAMKGKALAADSAAALSLVVEGLKALETVLASDPTDTDPDPTDPDPTGGDEEEALAGAYLQFLASTTGVPTS
jgi:hypothetical protein